MQTNAGISDGKDIMPDAINQATNDQQHHQQPNQSALNHPNQSSGSTAHHHMQHATSNRHPQSYYHNPRMGNPSNVNHVLLITVINPHYSINCHLIHQICSAYGKINRIVIFKKNGVQAMVEFDNVESAKRAKNMLYGCDIYSGCCTLRIEYAKPSRLNIHKNDNDSFDYTNPNLGSGQDASSSSLNNEQQHIHHQSRGTGIVRGGLFHPTHHHHHHHHPQSNAQHHHIQQSVNHQHGPNTTSGSYGIANTPLDQQTPATADAFHQDSGFHVSHGGHPYSSQPTHHHMPHETSNRPRPPLPSGHNHSSSFSSANTSNALMPGNHLASPQGTVMMVYGLQPERLNCDRLFNLFCLYGNVARVSMIFEFR